MLLPHELAYIMLGHCAAKGLIGPELPKFCLGLSTGIIIAFIKKNKVFSSDKGPIGPMAFGSGKGIQGLKPQDIYQIAVGLILIKALFGIKMPDLLYAITLAVVQYFSIATDITTVHFGVAQGVTTGKLLNLFPGDFTKAIMEEMAKLGFSGGKLYEVVDGVASAFTIYMLVAGTVAITITGLPTPPPTQGSGNGIGVAF